MYKLTIISDQRCGSTSLARTIHQMSGMKFWIEPNFNEFKNTIDSIGFKNFLEKMNHSEFIKTLDESYVGGSVEECDALKCDYKTINLCIDEVIGYSNFVIILLRKNLFEQALSRWIGEHTDIWHVDEVGDVDYYNLEVPEISLEEVNQRVKVLAENKQHMIESVTKGTTNHRIIYYEDNIPFLSGNKLNTKLEMIKNYKELKEKFSFQ